MRRRKEYSPRQTSKNRHLNTNSSAAIQELREWIKPLFVALFVTFAQYIFHEDKQEINSEVQFRYERLKLELPTLNKILAFTDGLDYSYIKNCDQDTFVQIGPAFLYDESMKQELFDDIEEIKRSRGILEHHIYREVEDIIRFLRNNPIPIGSPSSSSWLDERTIDEWLFLTTKLNYTVQSRLNNPNRDFNDVYYEINTPERDAMIIESIRELHLN